MAKLDTRHEARPPQKSSSIEMGEIDDSKHPIPTDRCPWKDCNKTNCRKPWHRPYSKTNAVENLKPVLVSTGTAQIIFGGVFAIIIVIYAVEFDRLFIVEKSIIIRFLTFGALVALAASGIVLLTTVMLDERSVLWLYIIVSTFLCVFIFGLSVMMIRYGLHNVSEPVPTIRDPETNSTNSLEEEKVANQPKGQLLIPGVTAPYQTTCGNNFMLSKAFIIGVLTLLGSVVHFVGTVIVFTYYNLKYIHPMMFYCHQQS